MGNLLEHIEPVKNDGVKEISSNPFPVRKWKVEIEFSPKEELDNRLREYLLSEYPIIEEKRWGAYINSYSTSDLCTLGKFDAIKFRKRLIKDYSSRCALYTENVLLTDACHIISKDDCDDDKLNLPNIMSLRQNGVLMSVGMHRSLDNYMWAPNPCGIGRSDMGDMMQFPIEIAPQYLNDDGDTIMKLKEKGYIDLPRDNLPFILFHYLIFCKKNKIHPFNMYNDKPFCDIRYVDIYIEHHIKLLERIEMRLEEIKSLDESSDEEDEEYKPRKRSRERSRERSRSRSRDRDKVNQPYNRFS